MKGDPQVPPARVHRNRNPLQRAGDFCWDMIWGKYSRECRRQRRRIDELERQNDLLETKAKFANDQLAVMRLKALPKPTSYRGVTKRYGGLGHTMHRGYMAEILKIAGSDTEVAADVRDVLCKCGHPMHEHIETDHGATIKCTLTDILDETKPCPCLVTDWDMEMAEDPMAPFRLPEEVRTSALDAIREMRERDNLAADKARVEYRIALEMRAKKEGEDLQEHCATHASEVTSETDVDAEQFDEEEEDDPIIDVPVDLGGGRI